MKITVAGHLCLDVIHHPDGSETQSYGGIFFSIAALANILPPSDTILPVLGVGKEEYEAFVARLSSYPNVDPGNIFKFAGPTNRVSLHYANTAERVECSRNISEPIPIKRLRSVAADSDMILVNMISGHDITIETMDELRMEARENHTPIYLDVHSLTLGIGDDFTRFHRPVELWRRWLFMLHTVQMNEREAAILSHPPLSEDDLAKHTLALNTKVLIITRGDRGCTAFVDEKKHIHRTDFPTTSPEGAVDPTGCGDVFSAAYCAHLMHGGDVLEAVRFANSVATFKAGQHGSQEIDSLAKFRLQGVPAR